MANPVDIANELNKLILQQNQGLLKQAGIQRNQLSIMIKMAEVMEAMNPGSLSDDFAKINEELQKIDENLEALGASSQENMSKAATAATKVREEQERLSAAQERYEKIVKRVGQAVILGSSFFGGMGQAMQLVKSIGGGLLDILGSVTSTLFNVGAAIISAPFKMLGSLMESASQGGGSELRQALEDIRKQFGDLSTGSSKAITSMAKSMKGELANTGLSTYRIFGTLAERLNAVAEYAKQLGPLFTNLSAGMVKNAEAVGAYVKGLGLTEEGMRGIGATALATGKSFTEVGREVTSFAFQMGDAFGINGKEISRDVATMMKDVKNFGNLSVKQLTQVTVYARKLGLEFKDMQGVIDKFDNFEDAAEGAAQLSQAFGMNVNALELVQEQDPAARFDKLRKAFYSTGKSVESMTRQELKLLAAQTGLSEEAVKLGFAQANQGVSYDEVQKKAGAAEKKQLTQAEAMEKLANSIERMVKSGGQQTKSFFEAFTNGFTTGIARSKEFREMMRAIGQSLRIVFRAGREVGKAFVDAFPGVKNFFGGIRDLFNPGRIQKLMSGVVTTFKKFFKDVSEGKGSGFSDLMKNLKKNFFDFFSLSEGPGRKIMTAIKDFAKGLVTILAGLAKEAMAGLTTAFKMIAEFIKDPSKAFEAAKGAGGGILSSLMELLQPLFDAVVEAWPALKDSFVELLAVLWENIKPTVMDIGKKILLFIFGMGVFKTAQAGIMLVATEAAKTFMTGFKDNLMAGKGIGDSIRNAFKSPATRAATGGADAIRNTENLATGAADIETPKPKSDVASWKKIAQLALGIAAAAVILAAAYVTIEYGLKASGADTSLGRVMEVGAVLGVMALTFIAIGVPLAIMAKQNFSGKDLVTAGIAFVAIGAASVLLALAYVQIDKILPKTNEQRIEMVGDIMWIMTKTFVLVGLGLVLMALQGAAIAKGAVTAGIAFVAIGVAVGVMAWAYLKLDEKLGDVKAERADMVERTLNTMMKTFALTGFILLGAAALGGLLISGFGIGAVAIIAGMAALRRGVLAMADTAVEIMEKLEKSNVSSGFEAKMNAFVQIMEVTVKFGSIMTEMLRASQPSAWTSIFSSKATPMTESLAALGDFVRGMTSNLSRFLKYVVEMLSGVPESSLATFQKFGGVLTAITDLISNLVPNFGNFEVDEGDVEDFKVAVETSGKFFKGNLKSIENFLPAVKDMLKALSGFTFSAGTAEIISAAFSGIGAILGTVPNILSTIGIMTRRKTGENESQADAGAFAAYASRLPGIFSSISSGLTTMAPALQGAISAVINTVKDLTEPQMKRAGQAFALVGTILFYSKEFINSGLKTTAGGSELNYTPSDGKAFSSSTITLSEIFDNIVDGIGSLGQAFPGLIKTVLASFKGMSLSSVKDARDKITVFFEVLSTASNIANTLKELAPTLSIIDTAGPAAADQLVSGGPTAGSLISSVSDYILQLSTPMSNLVSTIKTGFVGLKEGEFKRVEYGFKQFFGILSYIKDFTKPTEAISSTNVGTQLAFNATSIMDGIIKAAENINNKRDALAVAMEGFDPTVIFGAAKAFDAAITEDTGKSLKAVVDRLNKINSDLTSIAEAPGNIGVLLQGAADNLSLKGKGALTINKPDFTVNINVEVKLLADEFEKALIARPGKTKFEVKGGA